MQIQLSLACTTPSANRFAQKITAERMGTVVEKRADDTIASMHATSPSDRFEALRTWVDSALTTSGSQRPNAWEPVVGDASFRRFYRVRDGERSFIAMDAPPSTENNAQFVRLSHVFRDAGVNVPEVYAYDFTQGFLLVSDLGELSYASVYETAEREAALDAALGTMIAIARVGDGDGAVPPYTVQRFRDELQLFETWLLNGLLGRTLTSDERGLLKQVTERLVAVLEAQPKVCVHRDFHSRNLLWGPDRHTRVVDFQDALHGPLLYDLASLLRDCYVRFPESEIARWRERFRTRAIEAGLPIELHDTDIARRMDLTAMQRHLKAVGIFARLELRDSRPSHLVDIVPVLEHVIDVGRMYAEFAPFARWLADVVLPDTRRALEARGVRCAQ